LALINYRMLKKIFAVTVGALLYSVLNLIIIIGPLISGFVAGWLARCRVKEGFIIGVLSATLGFCISTYIINFANLRIDSFLNILIFWILLLWNLVGFLFSGIGGALGSMLSEPIDLFSFRKYRGRVMEKEPDAEIYVICPNCGFSNPEKNEYCNSCGTKLVG